MTVIVGNDFRLRSAEVKKGSGHAVLGEAALKAVTNSLFSFEDIGTNTVKVDFKILGQ